MKRCIAAVALALLAFPGGALAASDLRADPGVRSGSLGVAPQGLPQLEAQGTDVAAPDQQAPLSSTPPAADFAVADDDGGFDWGDAGIGAAAMASLMGVSLAGGMALSRRRQRHTSALAG
jgi:hypothetical protein